MLLLRTVDTTGRATSVHAYTTCTKFIWCAVFTMLYRCYSINSFGKVGIQFQVKIIEVTEFCGKRVSHLSDRSTRVIGGKPILNAQTWPWMVRNDMI